MKMAIIFGQSCRERYITLVIKKILSCFPGSVVDVLNQIQLILMPRVEQNKHGKFLSNQEGF